MKIKAVLMFVLLLTGCSFWGFGSEEDDQARGRLASPGVDMSDMYMTKAYETAASRAAIKMLDETADIYETPERPKIYIKQTQKNSPNLPDGFYTARRALKSILGGSGAYIVVDDMYDAHYLVESSVSEFNLGNGLPAILFKLSINDAYDQPFRAWNVVIRQMAEDQSWW